MHQKQMMGSAMFIVGALLLGGCAGSTPAPTDSTQMEVKTTESTGGVKVNMEQKDTEMQKPVEMKKNIVVIFDASGSMNAMLGSEKKIDIAKKSLNAYIDSLSPDVNVSLLTYGEIGSSSQADKAASCAAIDEKYYLGAMNAPALKGKINAILAKGWTPITNALTKANTILAAHPGEENRIVLVSDGEETCGGDPVTIAQKIKAGNAKVDVVGFDVKGSVAEALKNISIQGGGGYISIKNADDFSVVIKNGTINALTPDSMVSVGADGNVSVQTDAANVKIDGDMMKVNTGDVQVNVKPGEMPDIKIPTGM
ncbi:MAG: VWA domain-containing protein [Candidatus Moraniibacteriota bacterium]